MDVFQGIIARNECNLSQMEIKMGLEVLYCCWVLLSSLGVNNSISTKKKLGHPVCFCNILSAEGWTSMEVNFLFWWVPGYWMFPSRNWLSLFHSIDINSPCNCFRRASIQKSIHCQPKPKPKPATASLKFLRIRQGRRGPHQQLRYIFPINPGHIQVPCRGYSSKLRIIKV